MTKEIRFEDVPAFTMIREKIHATRGDVEFEKAGKDGDRDMYVLRLRVPTGRTADLRLSVEMLSDLCGEQTPERRSELIAIIRRTLQLLE
jgi:hypothetical protein